MKRRTFVAASAALAASGAARGDNHGDKIRLGVIGCGRRGRSNGRVVVSSSDRTSTGSVKQAASSGSSSP